MPIDNIPFTIAGDYSYPILAVKIINPHTNLSVSTKGIIDTGADECSAPAYIAELLGHDLQAGTVKTTTTANGDADVYSHTSIFEIYHPVTEECLYTMNETPIDFMPALHIVLLGVANFLGNFILEIDYPQQIFSIKSP